MGKGYSGIEGDLYSFMEFSQKGRTAQFNFNGALLRFEKMHNVFAVSYFMTLNNNAILCSFKGDDTKGGSDIYISFKQANGKFEYPINIGGVVNSDLEETNPFLAADLETLYFSRRVNAKEQKIFMSRRLDDSWENWSEPIALPNPINLPMTENTDAFVTADGKTLYFVSNRKRGKDRDIYFVQLDDILSPTGAPLVKGKVVHNGRALENAVVEVQKVGVKTKQKDVSYAVSKKDGAYETPFKAEEDVAITATQKGYISEVILPKEARKNAQNIEMTKLDRGNRFVLKSILFKRGEATFLPISSIELEHLKSVLLTNPTVKVQIEGHTDGFVSTVANQAKLEQKAKRLSLERANAVKAFLIQNGIASSRIQTKGLGSSQPRFSNKKEAERKKNRRVEVLVL